MKKKQLTKMLKALSIKLEIIEKTSNIKGGAKGKGHRPPTKAKEWG